MSKRKILLVLMTVILLHLIKAGIFNFELLSLFNNENNEMESQESEEDVIEIDTLLWTYTINDELFPRVFDTISTNSRLIKDYLKIELKNKNSLKGKELINYLKTQNNKINERFCALEKEDLYDAVYNFNIAKEIPLDVYVKLVPHDQINTAFKIEPNEDSSNYLVTRKFEKFYAINELENHIQLIVLGSAKRFINMYLRTYKKSNFEFVDELNIYSTWGNSDTTLWIKSCYEEPFDELTLNTIIHNGSLNTEDTIKTKYSIDKDGIIKKE